MEPVLHPDVDLVEEVAGHVGAHGEEHEPDDDVGQPARGQPEHGDEEHEDEKGEADVALGPEHEHGEGPGHEDRSQGTGVEDEAVAEPVGGDGEELPLLGEVRGEEDTEGQLGQLHRLSTQGPDVDPELHRGARGADGQAQMGDER
jgi:hypothetical protein